MQRYFRIGLLLMILALPVGFAFAATSGLIPCGNVVEGGKTTDQCKFEDLLILVKTVINFLIFKIAAPIAAVMFAYAGYTYLTNGGNESKIKEAHGIFLAVFWGLVLALAAWLIVNFVLTFFLGEDSTYNYLGVE
jgi:hypothetical protein